FLGNGFTDLVVGNNGDGRFALFTGGPGGLSLSQTITAAEVPSPTSLSFAGVAGGVLSFYAGTEGRETATLLAFHLGGGRIPGGHRDGRGPGRRVGAIGHTGAGLGDGRRVPAGRAAFEPERLGTRPGRPLVHRVGHPGELRRRILRGRRGGPHRQLRAR